MARIYEYHLTKKEKALELYKQALDIDKQNYQFWNAVSNVQIELCKYNDAIYTLNQIIKNFPGKFSNLKQLAEIQLLIGSFDSSEDIILKAVNLKKNQNILNLLSLCYLKQCRFNELENLSKKIINYKLYNIEEDIAYKRLLISKVY